MKHPDPNKASNYNTREYSDIRDNTSITSKTTVEFKKFVQDWCTKNDTNISKLIKDLLDDFFTAEDDEL